MCGSQVLPGQLGEIEHVDIAALIAPRPLLVESGTQDGIFPVGPAGAHGFRNEGEGRCRYLVASSRQAPEVAEYPELGQITVQGPSRSQTGDQLWLIHDVGKPRDE